jgi:hypothetical protein
MALKAITLTSPAFEPGAPIPLQHAGKGVGTNVSPALVWKGAPLETAEFVLIVEDPDAPLPRPFVHAIVIGIPPESSKLAEGALSALLPASQGMLGRNSFGLAAYVGPRALPGHGPHTYVFQILALRKRLSFAQPPSRRELVAELDGVVSARGRLDGTFEQR